MSILAKATRGIQIQPHLWLVYGVGKVGKTSLLAEAPNPIVIGPEIGSANMNVTRLSVNSYPEFMDILRELLKSPHEFRTLGIDSLDWLEPLVWEHVVATVPNAKTGKMMKSIDAYGYGDGYKFALEEWRKIISLLTQIRDQRGMNIIAIAHPQSKEAKDPTVTTEYNRYQLKLHSGAAALWKEFVDCVFFINYETLVASDRNGKSKAVANFDSLADRYIYTEWSTAWEAGNRFGLPPRIAYEKGAGWSTILQAISESNPKSTEVLIRNIAALASQIPNEGIREKVNATIEESKDDFGRLERLLLKVRTIINTPAA